MSWLLVSFSALILSLLFFELSVTESIFDKSLLFLSKSAFNGLIWCSVVTLWAWAKNLNKGFNWFDLNGLLFKVDSEVNFLLLSVDNSFVLFASEIISCLYLSWV